MKLRHSVFALAAAAFASGCFTTHVRTGAPPAAPSVFAQDRWHHAVVFGIAEISEPVDLDGMCPNESWARIDEQVSVASWFVTAVTGSMYAPRLYSVACAMPADPGPPIASPATQEATAPATP
jgi:hypothetical protein